MNDLVERLRDTNQHTFALWFEAAAEIERLQAELAEANRMIAATKMLAANPQVVIDLQKQLATATKFACKWEEAEAELAALKQGSAPVTENTSDGYHTFKELYQFRKAYNVALFNTLAATGQCSVHKSWKHNDGELCFGGGWFIVVAVLPSGQISNHYEASDWDLFRIPETEKALFEFDGHTGEDVTARLLAYTSPTATDRDAEDMK